MILSLRKIKKASLFLCLFSLVLFLLSQLFQLFSTLFPLQSPYQEPIGDAVKVSTSKTVGQISTTGISWLDRLFVFYRFGE